MMLFQMLHDGRSPYDGFFRKGDVEAAVAIASKLVHTEVVKFDRAEKWAFERHKLEEAHAEDHANEPNTLISAWLRTETLFRMCERCLAFEAMDRAEVPDLKRWADQLVVSENWQQQISELLHGGSHPDEEIVVPTAPDEKVCTKGQTSRSPMAGTSSQNFWELVPAVGDRLGHVLFQELWIPISQREERAEQEQFSPEKSDGTNLSLLLDEDSPHSTDPRHQKCSSAKIFLGLGVSLACLVLLAVIILSCAAGGPARGAQQVVVVPHDHSPSGEVSVPQNFSVSQFLASAVPKSPSGPDAELRYPPVSLDALRAKMETGQESSDCSMRRKKLELVASIYPRVCKEDASNPEEQSR